MIGFIISRTLQAVSFLVFNPFLINLLNLLNLSKNSVETRWLQNGKISKPINRFIIGQRNCPQCYLKIGLLGNGGNHGCGAIAIYNAMKFICEKDKNPNIADIIRKLEYMVGFNIGGLLGTNPVVIRDFLRTEKINANIQFLPKNIDFQIKKANVAILLFWDKKTRVHYVMAHFVNEYFWIYNLTGFDKKIHKDKTSIEEWLEKSNYLAVAIILSDFSHL
ncbi:MAG: hypothetical protein FWG64_10365 [Firmicutes bacterium]|nr:hypothetical protein [Bacillota bacterium]